MVMSSHIQEQMSPLVSLPPHIAVTPSTSSRQEPPVPLNDSGSLTERSGKCLSETAQALVRAMNSPTNVNDDSFPPGGFRVFFASSLGQDVRQESQKELVQLQKENTQLCDEIAMFKAQLNSSANKQPGKLHNLINVIKRLSFS